ncbi:MAG: hypothetical protein IKN89_06625, partial [Oscillospiraceae bacterium]|nr:hypothetical protein [Oscillospiraceae bacterium]
GTHPACIMFRHIARKSWPIQEVFPTIFRQSDENSDCAICAPELCGIALSAKPPLNVIAKPVRTLAVAIRTPVLFPLRPRMDEETDCHDRFAVSQ